MREATDDLWAYPCDAVCRWDEGATLDDVAEACRELLSWADAARGVRTVALPRPAGLRWCDVYPIMAQLDDRFVVVNRGA